MTADHADHADSFRVFRVVRGSIPSAKVWAVVAAVLGRFAGEFRILPVEETVGFCLIPRMETGFAGQLLPQGFLLFGDAVGHLNPKHDI